MATVWRLSLNPSKVVAVTPTTFDNSFHRRIADGKNDSFQDIFLFLVYFYIYVDQDFAGFCKGKKWVVGFYHFSLVIRQRTKQFLHDVPQLKRLTLLTKETSLIKYKS
jgi:hypothetical protein